MGEQKSKVPSRTFDECYPEINIIVERKRRDWTFKASLMTDYDDVKSHIMLHIWRKWDTYDQKMSLGGWVATIVKNQFQNILKEAYTSTSSPCSQCPCNLGIDGSGIVSCSLFGTASVKCAKYAKWYDKKRHSHNVRLPVPLENHQNEYNEIKDTEVDLESAVFNLHERMREKMTKSEWAIYECIFVKNMSDVETSEFMKFTTNEKGRLAGYGRINQVKTMAPRLAREIISENGVETFKQIK